MAKILKVRNAANTDWVEIASSVPDVSGYLSQSSASSTYATINYVDTELSSIDLSEYLTLASASTTYATTTALNTKESDIIKRIPHSFLLGGM